jgi:solute carrier family 35 protein F1/2
LFSTTVQVSQIDETELSTLDDSDSSQSDDDDYKHGNNALHSTTQPPQFTLFGVIPLQAHAFTYLPMALLDVYGNYFTVMALKLTTLTSVSLFDALAIPSAMILSRLFLNRRYTTLHFLGVLACSVGIGLNVMQDYAVDVNDVLKTDYPNMIQGDLLAILAGFMFGVSNVLGEVAVRSMGGPNEYLGMVGFWGTVICAIQTLVIEQDEVAEFFGKSGNKSKTCGESLAWWLFTAYWATSVLSYLGTARFLQVSEATFFNLSLLTGDLWSVAFSVVAEKIVPKPAFFVALVFTVAGVVLYEMAPSPILEDRIDQAPRETQHDATAFETEEDSAEIQLTGVKYE